MDNFILRQIEASYDVSKLSLGSSVYTPLKIFLKKSALDFHRYEIARTYVLINQKLKSPRVFGYITLMTSEILLLDEGQRPQESIATARYEAFPAVKIARLAIDKSIKGQGFGSMCLDWCLNHIKLAIMPHVGCRFLVVDSKQNSVDFYKRNGFTLLNTDANYKDEHPLMFFDLYKNQ